MENTESCCIAKILKVIDVLQKECFNECFPEGCEKDLSLWKPLPILWLHHRNPEKPVCSSRKNECFRSIRYPWKYRSVSGCWFLEYSPGLLPRDLQKHNSPKKFRHRAEIPWRCRRWFWLVIVKILNG